VQQPFKPGARVQMDVAATKNAPRRTAYTTIVAAEPHRLVLGVPPDGSGTARIQPGTELTLWRYKGITTYMTTVTVIAAKRGDPPLIVTSAPRATRALDRRTFYRVKAGLPFRSGEVAGEVRDLSGNGLLVAIPAGPFSPGGLYEVEVDVPGAASTLCAAARAVRVQPGETEDLVGMAFEKINRQTQEELVRYIFRRQRELIRLGELGTPWRKPV